MVEDGRDGPAEFDGVSRLGIGLGFLRGWGAGIGEAVAGGVLL